MLQTAQVDPDQLKAPSILSNTTIRRSAVDREGLKPYWKSEKKVFQRLYQPQKEDWQDNSFLAVNCSPIFLNIGTTDETFKQSGE